MNRLKTLSALIIILLFCQVNAQASYNADQPIAQIAATVDQAIVLLHDKNLQGADKHVMRQQRLFKLVDNRFDFELMGQLALGKFWRSVDSVERQHFLRLFAELLKNTYVRRVNSYSGEKIIFTKQVIRKNLALIYSYYNKNNDQFSINYKMKKNGNGQWLVFDVVIEGVSVVKQYRKQFGQILQNESMQALIKRLDDKVKALVHASAVASVKS
jgi:phospholipid transport system substrate-binding protein